MASQTGTSSAPLVLPGSKPHFAWLDMMRFLAAFMVLVFHARRFTFAEYGALPDYQHTLLVAIGFGLARIGHESVILFFVLSGFLVGGKAIEKIRAGTFKPLDYSVDRFTRIMLPLTPAIILTAIVTAAMGQKIEIWQYVGNLLSLQGMVPHIGPLVNDGALWSLSFEVWFYIIAGAAGVAILGKRWRFPAALVLICFAFFFVQDPSLLFCWLFGALAYVVRPQKASVPYLMIGLAVMLYGVAGYQIGMGSISVNIKWFAQFITQDTTTHLLMAAGMALFIQQISAIRPTHKWAMNLDASGTKLAAFSYTLYLTHTPITLALRRFITGFDMGDSLSKEITLASGALFFGMIAAGMVGAWLIYLPFERRTGDARRFIMGKIAGWRNAGNGNTSDDSKSPTAA
jgi:peptidoglycan/LPS O-acetylase OafA/YrhL